MSFSIPIDEVVDLLGLEREPRSAGRESYNVKCPFCGSRKYKMNINTRKNVYRCFVCTPPEARGLGTLDLYGRAAFGTPCIPGKGGNSAELYEKLCEALHRENPGRIHPHTLHSDPEIQKADDADLDRTYSALISLPYLSLSEKHRENLIRRGLSEEAISRNGYASIDRNLSWLKKAGTEQLEAKNSYPLLKNCSDRQILAGLAIADDLSHNYGCSLERVPGFFLFEGRPCLRVDYGMIIPTRNPLGQIVGIQFRKDSGSLRYMTLSSKGLPGGVTTGISGIHFPIGNSPVWSENCKVLLTEGPLKADVARSLLDYGNFALIALQGVNSTSGLRNIFRQLREAGVSRVYSALDMDKLCNANVRRAEDALRKLAAECGIRMPELNWDTYYAEKKRNELRKLAAGNAVTVPKDSNPFTEIRNLAIALEARGIDHSNAAGEIHHYWSPETKGIDDYLLTLRGK